jgi:hypothetical protein
VSQPKPAPPWWSSLLREVVTGESWRPFVRVVLTVLVVGGLLLAVVHGVGATATTITGVVGSVSAAATAGLRRWNAAGRNKRP